MTSLEPKKKKIPYHDKTPVSNKVWRLYNNGTWVEPEPGTRFIGHDNHFFKDYPLSKEEVRNNNAKFVEKRQWYSGPTYNELVSRIDTLEKEHKEMRSMIENLSKNNTRRNTKNNRKNRGFVQTLRNKCKGKCNE